MSERDSVWVSISLSVNEWEAVCVDWVVLVRIRVGVNDLCAMGAGVAGCLVGGGMAGVELCVTANVSEAEYEDEDDRVVVEVTTTRSQIDSLCEVHVAFPEQTNRSQFDRRTPAEPGTPAANAKTAIFSGENAPHSPPTEEEIVEVRHSTYVALHASCCEQLMNGQLR